MLNLSRFTRFSWGKFWFRRFTPCKRFDISQLCCPVNKFSEYGESSKSCECVESVGANNNNQHIPHQVWYAIWSSVKHRWQTLLSPYSQNSGIWCVHVTSPAKLKISNILPDSCCLFLLSDIPSHGTLFWAFYSPRMIFHCQLSFLKEEKNILEVRFLFYSAKPFLFTLYTISVIHWHNTVYGLQRPFSQPFIMY